MKFSFGSPPIIPFTTVRPGQFFLDNDGDLCLLLQSEDVVCFPRDDGPFLLDPDILEKLGRESVILVTNPVTFSST